MNGGKTNRFSSNGDYNNKITLYWDFWSLKILINILPYDEFHETRNGMLLIAEIEGHQDEKHIYAQSTHILSKWKFQFQPKI